MKELIQKYNFQNQKPGSFNENIFEACIKNDFKSILYILFNNPELSNLKDKENTGAHRLNSIPLHYAVTYCDYKVIELLIDFKSDVNSQNYQINFKI